MAKKKLNLGNSFNPAMQFISVPIEEKDERAEQPESSTTTAIPEGYRVVYVEKKSKRLQLLIQPSLYDLLKKRADAEGSSVNDTIHRILDDALRGE